MVYANTGSMRCFECGDINHKRIACPHKAQDRQEETSEHSAAAEDVQEQNEHVQRLTVLGPSGPLVVPLGSSVVLPCSVDELLSVKDLEVEWRRTDSETLVHLYQDGESRTESQKQDYQDRAHFFTDQIQHGNFSLRLDNLRAEDEGQYKCKVYIQQESGETVVQIKVNAERLLVSGSSRSISASVGEDVTLNCSVDSHIPPGDLEEVTWTKTDEDIQVLLYQDNEAHSSNERYRDRVELFPAEIPKGNFSLRLKSVRTEDKGVYMCQVFAGGLSANATVVLERLGFSASHIMILIFCISASGSALLLFYLIYCKSPTKGLFGRQTYDHYFNLGSSVVLPCHVDECLLKKTLKVEWRRKDTKTLVHLYEDGASRSEKQHKDYQDRAHFFTDDVHRGNFSLRLDNLRAADAGEYICTVHSDLSTLTRSAETSLKPQFKVKGSSDDETIPLGGSVVLSCQVDESLIQRSLKVEWRRADSETLVHLYEDGESRPKKQHKDYHHRAHFITEKIKEGNFSIRLEKLRAEDAGKYTCKVYIDQDCVHSADRELEILRFNVQCHTLAPLGSSVVLPSYKYKPLSVEGLKVEWRRKDTLVHLYQDGESRAEEQDEDYQDRAHFFTDQIQHGDFSLHLDNLKAGDEGKYICTVYSQQKSVFSAWTNLELKLLVNIKEKLSVQALLGEKGTLVHCDAACFLHVCREIVFLGVGLVAFYRLCGLTGLLGAGADEALMNMALQYTSCQLLSLKWNYYLSGDTYDRCDLAGLLRPKRYIHRSTGRSYISSSSSSIPVLNCRRRTTRLSSSGVDLTNFSALPYERHFCDVASTSPLKAALLNTHSVNNKALLLADFIVDKKLDSFFITETWHKQDDGFLFNQLTPAGFGLIDVSRTTGLPVGRKFNEIIIYYVTECDLLCVVSPDTVFRLQMFLVFCPNVLMFLAFVLWGVSEGSLFESVSCCALYFLRPFMLLWTAPYINKFTGNKKTWVRVFSFRAEYIVFSAVFYSVLFKSALDKSLNYTGFEGVMIIVLFVIVILFTLLYITFLLLKFNGKSSQRMMTIFNVLASISLDVLPSLQFILLFTAFGSARGGFIIVAVLPVFTTATRYDWNAVCGQQMGCSPALMRSVWLTLMMLINAVLVYFYITALENEKDRVGWVCVIVFLQTLWTLVNFTRSFKYVL
ncbi:uncharacterized protein LOC113081545 [Carassius auratus]|uniref:Uncharacterized protein LOC113081545 n=1 Tax=Carassius auratus TaxID=7957 RepID=A0A6P6NK99_CARAU|nr:uncharacterized protein LOC113081545 [Carassius auratus]